MPPQVRGKVSERGGKAGGAATAEGPPAATACASRSPGPGLAPAAVRHALR